MKQGECDDRDGERYQKRDEQSFCEVGEQAHISVRGAATPSPTAISSCRGNSAGFRPDMT